MTTRWRALLQQYRADEAFKDLRSPVRTGDVVRVPIPLSREYLTSACLEVERRYGLRGFVSSEGVDADPEYANISLTCNPDMPGDPNYGTLGTDKLTKREHYYATPETLAKIGGARDSYYDTYGFCAPTPAATENLGELTRLFKRSLVRSRMSVIRGGRSAPAGFFWGWHKDEPVYENLRVNIHVTDSPEYAIQNMTVDEMPAGPTDSRIVEHQYEAGYGYSWDTNLPHRACAVTVPNHDRIALIYGVSPWFDLVGGEWVPNEFFGKKHPLQMLLDGDVL